MRPFDYATPWVEESGARIVARNVRKSVSALAGSCTATRRSTWPSARRACASARRSTWAGSAAWARRSVRARSSTSWAAWATLVVAPDTAKRPVWEAELARFLPHVEAIVLGNTTAQRGRALGHARQLSDAGLPFVLVVHYEALAVIAGKGKTAKGAPRSASAGPSSGSARTCS